MDVMKASNTGKCYESDIDKYGMWCIQCFPNGDNAASKGDVELYIQLCSLPRGISKLEIKYTLKCLETLSCDTRIKEFDYDNDQSAKWSHDVLSFDVFKKYDIVTFTADIIVLNKYDLKGDLLTDTEQEWNWYLKQNKYFKQISYLNKKSTQIGNKINNKFTKNRPIIKYKNNKKHHFDDDIINDSIVIKQELNGIKSQISQLLYVFNELKQKMDDEKPEKIEDEDECKDKQNVNDDNTEKATENENENENDDELCLWLRDKVGLEQYYSNFIEHGFDDLNCLKYITMNELNIIGIKKIGHKLKLMDYIQQIVQK